MTAAALRMVSSVARETDPSRLARAIVAQTRQWDARFAVVHLTSMDHRELLLAACEGVPRDLIVRLERIRFDDPNLCARTAATRTLQVVPDGTPAEATLERTVAAATGSRSLVCVPLMARTRFVGTLTLGAAEPTPPDAEQLEAIGALGELFALLLANARIVPVERRLRAEVEVVHRAALDVGETRNLRQLLQRLADQARALVDAEYAAVGIISDPDRPFDPWVFSGMPTGMAEAIGRFPRPIGLLGAVPEEGRSIRLRRLRDDPRFKGFPPGHPEMTSFLGVPLRYHERSLGHIYLANKRGEEAFSREDQEMVELLARHASISLEHARIYDQLLTERVWLRAVIERSPVPLLLIEKEGARILANRRAEELLGFKPDPDGGVDQILPLVKSPDRKPLRREDLASSRALRGAEVSAMEEILVRPDGREVPILVSSGPIEDAAGQIIGVVVSVEDISLFKELARGREEWISMVAHDLRQPLTVIQMQAGRLIRDAERQAPALVSGSERILEVARRLSRMVADLLDATRLEADRLEIKTRELDVAALLREALDRFGGVLEDHPLRLNIVGTVPPVSADPDRLEQILGNLLSNACKYGYPKTPITVRVSGASEGAVVSVTNEGPGIAPEEMASLFQRFRRTHQARQSPTAGIGLGLYIVHGLIRGQGGRIWADSEPGKETTFHFSLPPSTPPASAGS